MQPLSSENHVFEVLGGSDFSLFRQLFWVWILSSYFNVFLRLFGTLGSPQGFQNPSKFHKSLSMFDAIAAKSPDEVPRDDFSLI